ncbi:hypothetical protein BDK51DRAFT_46122 [Blyttiomyces helicus]|uniref:Uncharacterized protein n=1 Tax=Blyttiomyces helicus TaxID=388810 RepID=A0A4P9W1R6_9FUNG|nr:hypothetical protein BDK51DRAFT_46122 [Blyttiomyces helicus]|eukprot:RKO84016.1 hypothetical protein BDK51DRAFT_46122 [Blyttiomyces helicus]
MLRLLFLSTALHPFRPTNPDYSEAISTISLDIEESCREPNPDQYETVFEIPAGLDPVRLCRKVKRTVGRADINQGLKVDVGYYVPRLRLAFGGGIHGCVLTPAIGHSLERRRISDSRIPPRKPGLQPARPRHRAEIPIPPHGWNRDRRRMPLPAHDESITQTKSSVPIHHTPPHAPPPHPKPSSSSPSSYTPTPKA